MEIGDYASPHNGPLTSRARWDLINRLRHNWFVHNLQMLEKLLSLAEIRAQPFAHESGAKGMRIFRRRVQP